jgi:hypothetical protein
MDRDTYSREQIEAALAHWQYPTLEVVLDGRGCLICGRTRGIMIPCGHAPNSRQMFRHPECDLRGCCS